MILISLHAGELGVGWIVRVLVVLRIDLVREVAASVCITAWCLSECRICCAHHRYTRLAMDVDGVSGHSNTGGETVEGAVKGAEGPKEQLLP